MEIKSGDYVIIKEEIKDYIKQDWHGIYVNQEMAENAGKVMQVDLVGENLYIEGCYYSPKMVEKLDDKVGEAVESLVKELFYDLKDVPFIIRNNDLYGKSIVSDIQEELSKMHSNPYYYIDDGLMHCKCKKEEKEMIKYKTIKVFNKDVLENAKFIYLEYAPIYNDEGRIEIQGKIDEVWEDRISIFILEDISYNLGNLYFDGDELKLEMEDVNTSKTKYINEVKYIKLVNNKFEEIATWIGIRG